MEASLEFYLVLLLSGMLALMLLWRLPVIRRSVTRFMLEQLLFRGLNRDHFNIFEQVPVATERGVVVISYVLVSRYGVVIIELDEGRTGAVDDRVRADGFARCRSHYLQQRTRGALARELDIELPMVKGVLLANSCADKHDQHSFDSVFSLYRWLLLSHPKILRIQDRLQLVGRLQRMKRYLPALVAMSETVKSDKVSAAVVDIRLARSRRRQSRGPVAKGPLSGSGRKV